MTILCVEYMELLRALQIKFRSAVVHLYQKDLSTREKLEVSGRLEIKNLNRLYTTLSI